MNNNFDKARALSDRDTAREKMHVFFETTSNFYHGFREVAINNTIDEISNNFDKGDIYIELHEDDRTITVEDKGRGMPINMIDDEGNPYWYLFFQKLFASGKYDLENQENSGINGCGGCITNFTSKVYDVTSCFNGEELHIRYEDGGIINQEIENLGKTDNHGTKITFKLDESCYSVPTIYEKDKLIDIIDKACSVSPKVTIYFKYKEESYIFHYDTPMIDYYKKHIESDDLYFFNKKEYIKVNKKGKEEKNNVQLLFNKSFNPIQLSFLNNNNLINGGSPNKGFCTGLASFINKFGGENKLFDKVIKSVSDKDVQSSISFMISVGSSNVEYSGQAKFSSEKTMYATVVREYLQDNLEIVALEEKEKLIDLCNHVIEIARLNSKFKEKKESTKQKQVKRVASDKLTICKTKDRKKREFIAVEGLSPAGSVRGGGFKEFQSVLATRGKIPNAIKTQLDKLKTNEEIAIFAQEMGLDFNKYDESKINYDKFIIMSDADELKCYVPLYRNI